MNEFQQQIVASVGQGALVLTANKRLFRSLRSVYDRHMSEEGLVVWPTASIFPFDGWLRQCLEQLGEGWRLLSVHQQRQLWEDVIAKAIRGTSLELMNLEKTVDTAVRAHNLLTEYAVCLDDYRLTEDQQMFQSWRQEYLVRCRQRRWLDQGGLAHRIIEGYSTELLPLPDQLVMAGFDQLPAGAEALLARLQHLGTHCRIISPTIGPTATVVRFRAVDEQHEIDTMGRWIRHHLEQGAPSVGVVVPDLSRRRSAIERGLQQQLEPAASASVRGETSFFSLSLGSPLAEQGVIAAALACLDDNPRLPLDQLSFLLRSPFIGGGRAEADQRALFEAGLRSLQRDTFSLETLAALTERSNGLSQWKDWLRKMQKRSRPGRSPQQWAASFVEELKQLGWPGEAALSSISYQALTAWYDKVLEPFAGLDAVAPLMNRSQAVGVVRRLAHRTEFQPEGPAGPVQVVGLLESSGLVFEHLWVMGLDEGTLPAAPQPNPFLPYAMQEKLQMPHAGFAREGEFAHQVLQRLTRAAGNVVLSYSRHRDGCERSASRLIDHIDEIDELPLTAAADLLSRIRVEAAMPEQWRDPCGPPLEVGKTGGGTALLKDQAHCPFRAFVHHRLRVRDFKEPEPGLSPGTRGDLVHRCLEIFWQQVKTQQALVQMSAEQRRELADRCASEGVRAYFSAGAGPSQEILQLEHQRLALLLDEWLEGVEMKRSFFTVVATEQRRQVDIGPLQISVVVDRIDQLADGNRVIIDYKTGNQARLADLLTEPPLEPQLPSYVGATEEARGGVKGVVIAKVRRGDCRLMGIADDPGQVGGGRGVIPVTATDRIDVQDWQGLEDFWRGQLERLAVDFSAGVATVTPFSSNSCRYCDLASLCRIASAEGGEE